LKTAMSPSNLIENFKNGQVITIRDSNDTVRLENVGENWSADDINSHLMKYFRPVYGVSYARLEATENSRFMLGHLKMWRAPTSLKSVVRKDLLQLLRIYRVGGRPSARSLQHWKLGCHPFTGSDPT